ncbi:hypothetical protein FRC04_003705 [Tulasnella sp. 424]|nr:hypothetical protein FRC04_003705 [Tulasnella sp. 424]
MHRASSAALHSWRTTRLARRVSSANAVARIKRPATTSRTDDIRKPDLQLSHFLAMERSSMKILHLEPLQLGGYPPTALAPITAQSPSRRLQDLGEPKSGGKAPQQTNVAPTLPSLDDSTPNTLQYSPNHISCPFLPSPTSQPTIALEKTHASDSQLDEPTQTPHVRRRFFHHHLTEAIRNRRVASAWHIYEAQKNRIRKDGRRGGRSVPTGLLHSLFALLAGAKPQTRLHYIRMKELAEVLRRRSPGSLREWEWNAMVNAAGRGFRKTTAEDYRAATGVVEEWEAEIRLLKDMGYPPATVSSTDGLEHAGFAPSITTYNILTSIAARTGSRSLYQDALHRLEQFTGTRDAVTHLARITHYRKNGQLDQIPPLLEEMTTAGWPLHTDGANAVIWAYASNGHLDTARQIYNIMIPNILSSPQQHPPSTLPDPPVSPSNPILSIPSISKSLRHVPPDHRTYVMMLQAYSQAGQLASALDILQDYLTAISAADDSRTSLSKASFVRTGDKQMTAAFRGLFLGFIKHGAATSPRLSKRAFVGMSLKEAASALLLDMAPPKAESESSVPDAIANQFNTESLLSLFRFYIILTASYISEANHPLPLPPTQFVRTILLAFKNTAAPETASSLLNDVWRAIVSERLEPCGKKWVNQRDGWAWAKVRRDFGVSEWTNGTTLDR